MYVHGVGKNRLFTFFETTLSNMKKKITGSFSFDVKICIKFTR